MALIDNPALWILRLFEMEEREGRGRECVRFPEGARPSDISLAEGERVYGIYKQKYYFSPVSLIIKDNGDTQRIPWAHVNGCSSKHGEGKTFTNLKLVDGKVVRVRVADMATGWSGRISQLFHQMIERYGQRAAMGTPMLTLQEFFLKVTDDRSLAPNLEPHPSLESFRTAMFQIEQPNDGTRVFLDICDEEDGLPVADAIVVVTPRAREEFQSFVQLFRADGIVSADEETVRRVGLFPGKFNVWHILWD